jgi:hypothetical protein
MRCTNHEKCPHKPKTEGKQAEEQTAELEPNFEINGDDRVVPDCQDSTIEVEDEAETDWDLLLHPGQQQKKDRGPGGSRGEAAFVTWAQQQA